MIEVSFYSQQKELRFLYKTVLGIFNAVLRLRDWYVFIKQSLEILNVFITLPMKQAFWNTEMFFEKLNY